MYYNNHNQAEGCGDLRRIFLCILCITVFLTGCGIEIRGKADNGAPSKGNTASHDNNTQSGENGETGKTREMSDESAKFEQESNETDNDKGDTAADSRADAGDSKAGGGDTGGSGNGVNTAGEEAGGDSDGSQAGNRVINLSDISFDIDKQIKYKDLVNLSANELAILRNAIYAKHGYIFKSEKYAKYFSAFDWYAPETDDVNGRLTKDDKHSIALIQKAERFYEKSVRLSDDEQRMVGAWHLGAGVGAGYSDMYRFYKDGTYKYVISQMVTDERNVAHAGKWFVLDGVLYLRIEREGTLVGGELVAAEDPGSASEKEIVGAEYKIRSLEECEAAEIELDFGSPALAGDYGYAGVMMDDLDFYMLSPDPDDFSKDLLDI